VYLKNAVKIYPNIKFVLLDANHLPFKKNSFDLVLSVDLIEHLEDWKEVVNNFLEITRKCVLIMTHYYEKQNSSEFIICPNCNKKFNIFGHKHFFKDKKDFDYIENKIITINGSYLDFIIFDKRLSIIPDSLKYYSSIIFSKFLKLEPKHITLVIKKVLT
jgi:ubiquinone/menaquinone biosynthesis C-methylase UbiE